MPAGSMSLRLRIRSSLFWMAWSFGLRFCIQVGLSIVLARLLSPADFGRTGMVGGVLAVLAPFAGVGLLDAVIAAPDESAERLSSLFWLGVMLGLGMTVLSVLAAPLIALYYQDPSLETLTRVMACTFAFAGIAVVPEGLMRKRLAFHVVSRVEMSLGVISAGVAIVCALRGLGVWSLVVHSVLNAALASVAWLIVSGFRPSAAPRRATMLEGLSFGTQVSLSEVISLIANTAHTFVIGRVMGAGPVGLYARALSVPQLLQQQVGGLANSVTLPALASIDEAPRAKSAVLQTMAAIALVTAPIAGGLIACGDLVVAVLYGAQWHAAATPLRVLAAASFIQIALFPVASLYRARRRPDLLLRVAWLAMLVSVAGVAAGVWLGGLTLIAWLHLARVIVVAVPHIALGGGLVGLHFGEVARALQSPVGCAAAMSLLLVAMRHFVRLPPPVELAIAVPLGALAYGGLAFGLRIEPLRNVLSFLRQRA